MTLMLKVKPFRQSSGLCGPASLKMVLDYYGIVRTERELAKLARVSPAIGADANDIVRAAKKLGLFAYIKDSCEIKHIRDCLKRDMPVIVDWFCEDDGHYSVACGLDRENIYLQDPHKGHLVAMKLKVFRRLWFDFPGDHMKTKDNLILRRMIVVKKK